MLIRDGQGPEHPRRLAPRPARARNRPGRPGSSRISTSAAMSSTRTSAPSMGSTPSTFDGVGSSLTTSLSALSQRFRGLPLAGVLLFTDGNRTDTGDLDWSQLPPIYPVVPPSRGVARDIGVTQVSISQTNFESAPVVVRADVSAVGFAGETIVADVTDEAGKDVERQEAKAHRRRQAARASGSSSAPSTKGSASIAFAPSPPREEKAPESHRRRAGDPRADARQQQPAGRRRPGGRPVPGALRGRPAQLGVQVPPPGPRRRRSGPARRPAPDRPAPAEVRLPRHARPARPAASSTGSTIPTRTRPSGPTSRCWSGSARSTRTSCGTASPRRPTSSTAITRSSSTTWRPAFFTPDQLALLRNFVSQRGGGLLMLGGPDSFAEGKYDRTPVGELLPVYLESGRQSGLADAEYRLVLTREGWLQPWVRMRKTEDEEQKRLAAMAALPHAQPRRRHQAGGRGPLRGPRPGRQHRPGPGGPAVRQGTRRARS